ncbi:MAG: hypothetical protein FWD94_00670 [Treponema sp.]|nr:hypothetical protein [Treponema sp.]
MSDLTVRGSESGIGAGVREPDSAESLAATKQKKAATKRAAGKALLALLCLFLLFVFSFLDEGTLSLTAIGHLLTHVSICVLVCELIHFHNMH